MKKILFVAHSGKISGGANRSLLSLMTRLREDYGYAPCVLTPEDGNDLKNRCQELGIPVYSARYRSCCTTFQHEPKDILRLSKILIAPIMQYIQAWQLSKTLPQDFDLIYTNERIVAVGAFLAKRLKKPHIWHVRTFANELHVRYPFYWYSLMRRYSNRIILISSALYHSFLQYIPEKQLAKIHNGIELPQQSDMHKSPHSGYRLLLCGRIVPIKGQDEAIRALDILNRKGFTIDLYFAGDVPSYDNDAYLRSLHRQISEAGLDSRVHFLGHVENMTELRCEMDAELICTWCEAFGRVTVEAMSAGLPVVGTNSGGTPEIIIDGKTGFLYTSGRPDELAKRIEWLIRHPEEAAEIGQKGRSHVFSNFSINQTVGHVHQTIAQVLMEQSVYS